MTEITELLKVIKEQQVYFQQKETMAVSFRIKQLKLLKEFLKTNETDLLVALSKDLGKHPLESYVSEIGLLYHSIDFMIRALPKWQKKQRTKTSLFLWPAKSYTVASPYGNTLILSAFNYPLLLSMDPLIGAISGGNTAIVGLSEQTPHVNQVILDNYLTYFSQAYLCFYVSSPEKNTAVLEKKFDKIFFTGSPRIGKVVYQAASQHLTPVTLELGGKSPAIITNQAKVKVAAQRLAWGKFLNAGQTCVAPDYCLVDEQIADEFLSELKKAIKEMYGEEPAQSVNYSRLVSQRSLERLTELLEQDRESIYSGGKTNLKDNYLEPTILQGKMSDSLAVMSEEIFGPILPVLVYQDLEEAVAFVNSYEAPLAFYPFSENRSEINHLLASIQFGGATVNDTLLHLSNIHLPFGGVGNSGMGHYHGEYSFKTFTHTKGILERQTVLSLPIMLPPYTDKKEKLIKRFLK